MTETLLEDEWIRTEIRRNYKNILELRKNKVTTYQNLWDTYKMVFNKSIALSAITKNKKLTNKQPNDTSQGHRKTEKV